MKPTALSCTAAPSNVESSMSNVIGSIQRLPPPFQAPPGDADAAGHSLQSLALRAGYPTYSGKGSTQLSFRHGVPVTPTQKEYLTHDVQATRAVYHWQQQRDPIIPDLSRQTRWSGNVFALGRAGLRIDLGRLDGLLREAWAQKGLLTRVLKDAGVICPRGPKKDPWRKASVDAKVVQGLLGAAGSTELTESGDALARDAVTLRKSGSRVLRTLADYYGQEKWISLLEAYNEPGGVVRARYNPLVATGRMSCSAPNIQQVPKKGGLRECWIPSEGHVLVEADYAMLELYCFVDTCTRWGISSRMRDALNEGKDVHTIVAEAAGITRDLAKVFNYGGLGGMGAATMQDNIEKQLGIIMPVSEIKQSLYRWQGVWPEVRRYWDHNTLSPRGEKYLVTNPQSGRQRLAFFCAAQNYGFQGPGADVMKRALELAQEAGLPVVAVLHDQMLLDVEAKAAPEASDILASVMKQAGEEICPNVRWPDVQVHTFAERWKSK